mmetsp:Transcript_17650/g.26157  ORF Transcript_17650/g.26157 Transcript_17650/m.26157 type:complete len:93 (-) Transcript_17650:73-351(-)
MSGLEFGCNAVLLCFHSDNLQESLLPLSTVGFCFKRLHSSLSLSLSLSATKSRSIAVFVSFLATDSAFVFILNAAQTLGRNRHIVYKMTTGC